MGTSSEGVKRGLWIDWRGGGECLAMLVSGVLVLL